MSQQVDADRATPTTGEEQRQRTRDSNRTVAALLVGVSLVFLGGSFAVGLIVLYGPF